MRARCVSNASCPPDTEDLCTFGAPEPSEFLLSLTVGRTYDVLEEHQGLLRVVDDTGEGSLYPENLFELETAP